MGFHQIIFLSFGTPGVKASLIKFMGTILVFSTQDAKSVQRICGKICQKPCPKNLSKNLLNYLPKNLLKNLSKNMSKNLSKMT